MIELVVNGKARALDVEEDMPLLWALRDYAGLTGTRFGCGAGLCGACTVHVNGEAARSCLVTAGEAAGAAVTTIEGLSEDASHPVQRAWAELDVPQCGYCQSGQIMAAASLLAANPRPSDVDIDAAITNICRCATYHRIRRGVHRAAEIAADTGLDGS